MEWKKYFNDKLILSHPAGFYIIKPENHQTAFPFFCPLCERIMRIQTDEESFDKFSCCDACAITWAYPNKQIWKEGWRPDKKEILERYNR